MTDEDLAELRRHVVDLCDDSEPSGYQRLGQLVANLLAERDRPLFVVVLHDRHTDDKISVHATRESADAEIEAFKRRYEDVYTWHEQNVNRWLRSVRCDSDDGPRAHIEQTKLKGG